MLKANTQSRMGNTKPIPNWKRLGLKSRQEGIAYVLNFLKQNEKGIIKRGIDTFTMITVGNYQFMLGKQSDELGLSKYKNKKKREDKSVERGQEEADN